MKQKENRASVRQDSTSAKSNRLANHTQKTVFANYFSRNYDNQQLFSRGCARCAHCRVRNESVAATGVFFAGNKQTLTFRLCVPCSEHLLKSSANARQLFAVKCSINGRRLKNQ